MPATARPQDPGAERELQQARRHHQELIEAAESLEEAGHREQADDARRQARQWGAHIERAMVRLDQGRRAGDELHGVLEGLEHGMAALRKLGRNDQVERLEEIAAGVRREIEGREHRHPRDQERDVVRRRIKIMRYAVEALVDAKRHDAGDLVERAMHAREFALEGRRDDEARRIREKAPNRGQLAELLGVAAELLQDAHRAERAAAVADLAHEYARQQERRAHAERDERAAAMRRADREAHRSEPGPAEHAERFEAVMRRVEQLEQRMKRLTNAVEELNAALRQSRRDRP